MAERRYDPLADRWVIVSPQRVLRPWQGDETDPDPQAADWQPDCHLCPRNQRASGDHNPDYQGLFVFDNDFPALDAAPITRAADPLLRQEPVTGQCRVLCYHHQHNRTLATLNESELARVVAVWAEQQSQLGSQHDWVQIFENKGRMMGCSSEHPHGQIWASDHLPSLAATEERMQQQYQAVHRSPLLLDYANSELQHQSRIVIRNAHWLVVVPWWAAWPFETLLVPLLPLADFTAMSGAVERDLVSLLQQLLRAYDELFKVAMPYSMGWHGRGRKHGDHWQLHAHFYPPLLRSASVRKFMVGYEMLAEAQRDLTPEAAAERLRACLPA